MGLGANLSSECSYGHPCSSLSMANKGHPITSFSSSSCPGMKLTQGKVMFLWVKVLLLEATVLTWKASQCGKDVSSILFSKKRGLFGATLALLLCSDIRCDRFFSM